MVKLFQREAQALARLKHPGIAAICEAGRTEQGEHFFAVELVRVIPLHEYSKSRRAGGLPQPGGIEERLHMFCKICEAVNFAHQRGVIHRALKPSNILLADAIESKSGRSAASGGVEEIACSLHAAAGIEDSKKLHQRRRPFTFTRLKLRPSTFSITSG